MAFLKRHCRSKRGDVERTSITSGIYAAQIEALYRNTPMVLTVNVVNSGLVAIVLASYMGQTYWLLFLALTIALTGVRAFGWSRYRHCRKDLQLATKWAIFATLGSGLSGLLWGVGSALLLPEDLVEQTFVAFVIGGMCAASLVAFSNYLPAFVAYVFPAALPLAGRFFVDGWVVHGDMIVVFAAAMTLAAYNSTGGFVNGLRLNLNLVSKTKELTAANERLRAEIKQRRVAEEQLRQAHKMEAIGQLTGGIAHDFNNLLTVVLGRLEMARSRIIDDPITEASLQGALRAAERGAALTRHLLAFARRQNLDPRPVDIVAVLESTEKMLSQTIGPEIQLVIQSQPGICPAWADPDQLELAILNLALNARDAMPTGGTLRIEVENRVSEIGTSQAALMPGDYVVVSVSDTGLGMEPEVLKRAFEPFFTTKEAGRGSGLGLSIVHGFAAQSGGSVQITSSPDNGTTVDLWLPRSRTEVIRCANIEPEQAHTELRQARILVCDDDGDVLTFVGAVLRESGYTVWEADNPSHALEVFERERPIDLLLVDYAMPGMNGVALINRAKASQLGLKVLLISGRVDGIDTQGAFDIPALSKPFRTAELIRRVADILTRPASEMENISSGWPVLAAPE
jgi:signal transduction histidine kinase